MFGDIAHFLIDIIFTLFGAILILRMWMQAVRLPPRNPVSQGVLQATNWLVLPLRRVVPSAAGIDWASLLAAWLTAIVYLALVLALAGANPLDFFPIGLAMALLTVLKWALNLLLWLTLLMAILSWINPRAEIMPVLYYLTAPFLNPIRRVVPQFGGFDMSPLVLYVLTQVALIVVGRLGMQIFGM